MNSLVVDLYTVDFAVDYNSNLPERIKVNGGKENRLLPSLKKVDRIAFTNNTFSMIRSAMYFN